MSRRFLTCFFLLGFFLTAVFSGIVWIVDPWYHYHEPILGLPLCLRDGRYQNTGIAEYADYDTLLLGTSVTANMHTSDMDRMLGGKSLKLIVQGGYFADFYGPLDVALMTHDVKAVFWGTDSNCLRRSDADNPWKEPSYLFDENPINDVSYLLNKDMFFWDLTAVLERAWTGDFQDEQTGGYTWGENEEWGKSTALSVYGSMEKPEWMSVPADAFLPTATENLRNILQRVDDNPDVTFTFYLAPYSILFWHQTIQSGELDATLMMHRMVLEELTSRTNTRVFYFMDDTELITNLDNYCDHVHYSPEVCEQLLGKLIYGEPVAETEIGPRIDRFREYLVEYDYDAIWES